MNAALRKKLRLPENGRALLLQAPEGYSEMLGLTPEDGVFDEAHAGTYDFVLLFAENRAALAAGAAAALRAVKPDGLLWVGYPKGSSKLKTDLSRDKGWEPLKEAGLDGIALVSVDETWSAMRFRPWSAIKTDRQPGEAVGTAARRTQAEVLEVPEELRQALELDEEAQTRFEALAPSHRKAYLQWIGQAKRAETRSARIAGTVEKVKLGRKNPSDKGGET